MVSHRAGWRTWAVLPAAHARRIDTDLAPPSAHLGVLGAPGWTAYVGLLDVAGLRDGDVVYVSAAAGAVGSPAAQIAKLRGHTVVGSAGSAAKVAQLRDDLRLDAALGAMRLHGRVAVCGMVSWYNAVEPPCAPRNLDLLFRRRLTLRGFIVLDHRDRYDAFARDVGRWLAEGRLVVRETIVPGLDRAPAALIGLLRGENLGKMIVSLD